MSFNRYILCFTAFLGACIIIEPPRLFANEELEDENLFQDESYSDANYEPKKHEVYDFVIVGAGSAGCVIANRLAEVKDKHGKPKYTVCVLEAGRDDARLPELLPINSPAPVPQNPSESINAINDPFRYHWGSYTRGWAADGGQDGGIQAAELNRGFGSFQFFSQESENGPVPFRKTQYQRNAAYGGCTSHNFCIAIRNTPHNWQRWAALGLTDWYESATDATDPNSQKLIRAYKKYENRSQLGFDNTTRFYNFNPSNLEPATGSFPDPSDPRQQFYGGNGQPGVSVLPGAVARLYLDSTGNPFTDAVQNFINTTLAQYNYPNALVDLDWPPTAAQGGLSAGTYTVGLQISSLCPPG